MNRTDSGRRFRLFASQTFGCNFWMLCLPVTAFIVDGFYDGKAAINEQAATVPRFNQSCIWLSQCYQLNERLVPEARSLFFYGDGYHHRLRTQRSFGCDRTCLRGGFDHGG